MENKVKDAIKLLEEGKHCKISTKGFLERLDIEKEINKLLTDEEDIINLGKINGYIITKDNNFSDKTDINNNFFNIADINNENIMTTGLIQTKNFIFNIMKSKLGA